MTPTLLGRWQTRIVLILVVGLPWTILVSPLVTVLGGGSYADTLALTVAALILVGFWGVVVWEPLYHLAQQFRWEKDWPTGLGLVTAVPEGVLVWASLAGNDVPAVAFWFHFATTWLLMWFVVHGPLRVVAPRWRYRGGRFL